MVKSRPPLAGLVWPAFFIPGVARRPAALHPGLLLHRRLRRPNVLTPVNAEGIAAESPGLSGDLCRSTLGSGTLPCWGRKQMALNSRP
jgi:hypothetical protein